MSEFEPIAECLSLFFLVTMIVALGCLFITPWKIRLNRAENKQERLDVMMDYELTIKGFYFSIMSLIASLIFLILS